MTDLSATILDGLLTFIVPWSVVIISLAPCLDIWVKISFKGECENHDDVKDLYAESSEASYLITFMSDLACDNISTKLYTITFKLLKDKLFILLKSFFPESKLVILL